MKLDQNAALAYRQFAARGASPIGIIIMIYDVAIDALHRAMRAIDEGNIPDRVSATNKFFAAVQELRCALDFEQGGAVARRFGRFYDLARREVLEASMKIDRAAYQRYATLFFNLREAWKVVEPSVSNGMSAPVAAPVTVIRAPEQEPNEITSKWSA
jgi:flagellar secretion chaperone FliS